MLLHSDIVSAVAFNADASKLASGSNGELALFNCQTEETDGHGAIAQF